MQLWASLRTDSEEPINSDPFYKPYFLKRASVLVQKLGLQNVQKVNSKEMSKMLSSDWGGDRRFAEILFYSL